VKRIAVQGEGHASRVLVVDPREADLDRTVRGLEASGLKVLALRRPAVLVPVATAFRPHALVVATRAPEFTSLTLARQFHRQSHGAVPILYLIDAPDPQLRRYCLIKGLGVDVLSRPLDEVELLAKVTNWLGHDAQVERAGRNAFELRGPSLRDPLTGAFNRRWMLSLLAQETRRGERYGGSFSVLAARASGFRELKRLHGREQADRLLVHLSALLCQTVREADAVARVGDEEFSVFLPATPQEALRALRVRLARQFEHARVELNGRWIRPKVELGAVSFPDVVGTPTRLLSAAFEDLKRSRAGAVAPVVRASN
jgi:diguanylate cyclase (GGDEF)-like protein